MKITVIGCGRWGSFLSWYLDRLRHQVTLYGRPDSKRFQEISFSRSNGFVQLPSSVRLSSNLDEACDEARAVVISVPSQSLREVVEQLAQLRLQACLVVLCMKGLESETGLRLTQVAEQILPPSNPTAVWLGPGHVQEFYAGVPNCMVIDSHWEQCKEELIEAFSSDLIRFYYGQDVIGNEVGAAAKNVVGIGAGMLDGLGVTSLKGALMSRGTREIARLIKAMGGNELSAYGLCHLGDYQATVFSPFSHNRAFGEAFVKGQPYEKLAEGYYTVKALCLLAERYAVELPICQTVYQVLYRKKDPQKSLDRLFTRSLKQEF